MIHFSLVLHQGIEAFDLGSSWSSPSKNPHDQIISSLFFLTHLANLCSPKEKMTGEKFEGEKAIF